MPAVRSGEHARPGTSPAAVRPDAATPPTVALAVWRAQALQALLTVTSVVVAIAWVPGVWAAVQDGVWSIAILDTVVWVVVVALALARGVAYWLRASAFLVLWFVFATSLTVLAGPVGGGAVWLLATPVLAAVLGGVRAATAALVAIAVLAVALGAVLALEGSPQLLRVPEPRYSVSTWAATAGSIVTLGLLLTYVLHLTLAGLRRTAGGYHAAVLETEHALHEQRRLEGELIATSKARALGALANGVAHDLNNLVTPIMALGQLARDAQTDAAQRRNLELILAAGTRAQGLARRILVFGRHGVGQRTPIEVDPIVHEIAALASASAPEGVEVRADVGATGARVRAEETELHQLLMNPCMNAVRALRADGGTVWLRSRWKPGDGRVVVQVEDDGPGIAHEVVERVFEPYFTTESSGEGTGLGLSIVQHLVESLGGTVALRSERGAGVLVSIELPLAEEEPAPPAREDDPSAGPPPR